MYTLDFFFLCAISFFVFVPVHGREAIHRPKNKNTYIYFFLCFVSAHGREAIRRPKNKNIYFYFCLLFRFAPQMRPHSAGAFCVRSATEWPAFSRLRKCLHLHASRGGPPVPNKITQNVSYCIMHGFVFNKTICALVQNCTFCAILNSFWCCACLQFVVFVGVVLCSFLALSFASFLSRASRWQSHP